MFGAIVITAIVMATVVGIVAECTGRETVAAVCLAGCIVTGIAAVLAMTMRVWVAALGG